MPRKKPCAFCQRVRTAVKKGLKHIVRRKAKKWSLS